MVSCDDMSVCSGCSSAHIFAKPCVAGLLVEDAPCQTPVGKELVSGLELHAAGTHAQSRMWVESAGTYNYLCAFVESTSLLCDAYALVSQTNHSHFFLWLFM